MLLCGCCCCCCLLSGCRGCCDDVPLLVNVPQVHKSFKTGHVSDKCNAIKVLAQNSHTKHVSRMSNIQTNSKTPTPKANSPTTHEHEHADKWFDAHTQQVCMQQQQQQVESRPSTNLRTHELTSSSHRNYAQPHRCRSCAHCEMNTPAKQAFNGWGAVLVSDVSELEWRLSAEWISCVWVCPPSKTSSYIATRIVSRWMCCTKPDRS